ncbi:MAG: hypothetical protein WCF13_02535, partial [Stellaceae bacterium]
MRAGTAQFRPRIRQHDQKLLPLLGGAIGRQQLFVMPDVEPDDVEVFEHRSLHETGGSACDPPKPRTASLSAGESPLRARRCNHAIP